MYYQYRRQIKSLVGLVLLAVLVYGGIKGWMHYQVARAMDELSTAAIGHAQIGYGGIETELSGVVRVLDLSVQPQGAPMPVRIEQARVSGPNLGFFLWGQRDDDEPPPHLRVDLLGIAVALDPELIAAFEQDLPAGGGAACSPGGSTDPELLRELGLEQLRMDAALSYDYDAQARRLDARMDLDVHQIERVELAVELGDIAPGALAAGAGLNAVPTLASMSMTLHIEPEFGQRYLAACAERRKLDVDSLRRTLVAESLAELSKVGLQLGDGLRTALELYHEEWGDLRIAAEPPAPLNLMKLLFAEPGDWQRLLGVRVAVNRMQVQDLSFELRPANADELAVLLGEEPPRRPLEPKDRYRYVYRDRPVGSLADHVGAEVRLYLVDDQPMRAGYLVGISGGQARVEQRLHGGKITAHVALRDIRRLEVRQVEKIPAK